MIRQLHPDWAAGDVSAYSWDMPEPMGDLYYALDENLVQTAAFPSVRVPEKICLAEVDEVVRYHVSYHGEAWPVATGSTELQMYIVGKLVDGRWFSVVAWNDYTGWGCQDGSEIRVGYTEEQVVEFGLDEQGRKLLGY
jgi:hypothetical protein